MALRNQWSVASLIFLVQVIAVLLLSAAMSLLFWLDASATADSEAARLSLAVSATLADDPFVIEHVQDANPTLALQPYAVSVMDHSGVDFVTIMSAAGIRFTHRNPQEIGKKFIGTISAAVEGRSLTETFTGTLGPSVRAVVPIEKDGKVIAMVAAGVTVTNVTARLAPRIPLIVGTAILVVVVGSLGAYVGRRYLSRVTGALRPSELSRMVSYYQSVLHSVREGLILVDNNARVLLYNDEAAELLGLPPAERDLKPVPVSALDLPASLAQLMGGGGRAVEETHVAGHRVLLVNQEPATAPGAAPGTALGTVTTLRDRTELQALVGELESVRTLSEALRSQTHEFANRLHTVVSLLELGRVDDAITLIADEVKLSQALADEVLGAVHEPALAAVLLGKSAQASERGIDLHLSVPQRLPRIGLPLSDLVSVVGNLIDNAMDAAGDGASRGWVRVTFVIEGEGTTLRLKVSDSGRGVALSAAGDIFVAGYTTKKAGATGRGFGLSVVREIVERHGGRIELDQRDSTTFLVTLPLAAEGAR